MALGYPLRREEESWILRPGTEERTSTGNSRHFQKILHLRKKWPRFELENDIAWTSVEN